MTDPRPALVRLWDRLEARGATVRRVDLDHVPARVVRARIWWCEKRLRALDEGGNAGWSPHRWMGP